jgi:hypothetical protein
MIEGHERVQNLQVQNVFRRNVKLFTMYVGCHIQNVFTYLLVGQVAQSV